MAPHGGGRQCSQPQAFHGEDTCQAHAATHCLPWCLLLQVAAEERAREAEKEGAARRLKEAEARAEALGEALVEMREALERQRQAADLREEMLKQDLHDLERRCQASEVGLTAGRGGACVC